MSQPYRLINEGLINRNKEIIFKFNGKKYIGYEGDTLASALLANGVHLVGRSFKYHRPRGFFGAGVDEPNAKLQIKLNNHSEPNVNATEIELVEGIEATSQNCWPSVEFDVGAINNFLNKFFPAGFYYKTFMWPSKLWMFYEHFIRKSAGLGRSPTSKDKDIYDHRYLHCDVLVVGGGISGIIAAKIAAKNNKNTILLDDKPKLGGSTIYQNNDCFKIGGINSSTWLSKEIESLTNLKNLTVKTRTSLAAYHSYNYLLARENLTDHLNLNERRGKIRQRLWKIRAKKVIIASGSIERPLIFDNNDRPGIILSSSIKKYIDYYGVKCGQKLSLFTNNDSAYETAISLSKSGVNVNSIIDIRERSTSSIVKCTEKLGIKIHWKHTVINTNGYKKINSVEIMKLSDDGSNVVGNKINESCDCLGVSGGWTPMVHLFTQSGGKLKFRDSDQVFLPNTAMSDQISIGSCNGDFELDDIIKNTISDCRNFLSSSTTDFDLVKVNCPKQKESKNADILLTL